MRTTSQAGRDFIKREEGNGLPGKPFVAYLCQSGVPTIGYGHTGVGVTHADVQAGRRCTPEQAEAWLAADLAWAERAVNTGIKVPLSQSEFDALVSFTYNLGPGVMRPENCTLVRLLNAGDRQGAANQFGRWIMADGQPSAGLRARRARERTVFLTPDPTIDTPSPAGEGTEKRVVEPTPEPAPEPPPVRTEDWRQPEPLPGPVIPPTSVPATGWSWTRMLLRIKATLGFGAAGGTAALAYGPDELSTLFGQVKAMVKSLADLVGGPANAVTIVLVVVGTSALLTNTRIGRKILHGEYLPTKLRARKE